MDKINYPATLKLGSKGNAVKWLQSLLISRGALITIDGDFGPNTRAAVVEFQQAKGLSSDGIVGPETWGKLLPDVVSYKQFDSRWSKTPYTKTGDKSQTIGSSGCGPACTAMVAATWGHPKVTPVETCAEALAGGFRTTNDGTAHGYYSAFAKQYGYTCVETKSTDEVIAALAKGALVVASVGKGHFTNNGHFILLWAYDKYSAEMYVLDPGSSKAARTRAGKSVFTSQAKKYFIFTK